MQISQWLLSQPERTLQLRRFQLRLAACFGLAFGALTLAAIAGWLRPLDLKIVSMSLGSLPCWTIQGSQSASVLFAGESSLLYAALFGVLFLVRRKWLAALLVVGLLFAGVGVELTLKHLLFQPAPDQDWSAMAQSACRETREWSYPLVLVLTPNSFPSGYAIRAAYFGLLTAALLWSRWSALRLWLALLLPASLFLLAATRVVVAWHWTSDVLAGLVLGLFLALLVLAGQDLVLERRVGARSEAEQGASEATA